MYIRNKHIEKEYKGISKCPVCGKPPKIYSDFNYYGNYVKVQCKPLFSREPHCWTYSGKALKSRAITTAIEYWEDEVSNADFQKGRLSKVSC